MHKAQAVAIPTGRGESLWLRSFRKLLRKPKAVFALVVILLLYGSGLFAHWVAPYGYNQQDLTAVRQPPSARHWLGTDGVGRDILSRIIYSLRTNLIITAASVLTGSLLLGVTLGLLSGYLGGKVDSLVMRIGELFTAFPGILLVILMAATLKPRVLELVRDFEDATGIRGLVRWGIVDYFVVFGALAAFSWIGMARLVRGQVLSLKEQAFVESARAMGASLWRILLVHLLPNALPPVIVSVSMGLGAIAGAEVVLSWLGIGIQPPVPSLGNMIWEGQSISVLQKWPHMLLPPVVTVALLIFAWNLLGDALNDVLNPKAR
ncbi:Glutathione transport system permease protein GsiD [bacterium HR23]|nr:Glutathione transport system permease protein GsiD [bacterium HR23]